MFELFKTCPKTKARLGRLTTPSGVVDTPQFMPVGTCGAVKAMTPDELKSLGVTMILANTYPSICKTGSQFDQESWGIASIYELGSRYFDGFRRISDFQLT